MDANEAARVACEYFDGAPGLSIDIGFETVDISRFDFKEWEVECRVFSTATSKMVGYRVVIHDDKASFVERV